MTARIRPATPADGAFILALAGRFSDFELPAWRRQDEIDRKNRDLLQEALDHPGADTGFFVAEAEGGAPAGFTHLHLETDFLTGDSNGYVAELAVDPAFEGQGFARLLLECAEAWARTRGCRLLTLYVYAGNRRARRVYEKFGFAPEVVRYVKVVQGP
ncbi:MAG: GNAT family N-acetyltransferase [Chloroflexi bacterium]|nr:GNAT family N-acetyltransferase [Chloroflexota bacterium]